MFRVGRQLRRAARWLTFGTGPLGRGTDRVELFSRFVLLIVALAAAPMALWLGSATRTHLSSAAAEQVHTRVATDAVLLADAAGWPARGDPVVSTPASWVTPRGVSRTGLVPAVLGTRAGAKVRIWIAADGSPAAAPLGTEYVAVESVVAGVTTFIAVLLGGWGLHAAVCWRLARRRDRQWTVGWAAVEPVWARQRR